LPGCGVESEQQRRRFGRQSHDYVRYDTTGLSPRSTATGKVIGRHERRHRTKGFLRFLKTIDAGGWSGRRSWLTAR
jgi:hypothetical protein